MYIDSYGNIFHNGHCSPNYNPEDKMHLNTDGGITLAGVTLTAQQVREIKMAEAPKSPPKRKGWWLVQNRGPNVGIGRKATYLGFVGRKATYLGFVLCDAGCGTVLGEDGESYSATNKDNVIYWGIEE